MTSLKGVTLSTVDVSLTKAVYQHVEAKDFEQAHAVACLGVTQVNTVAWFGSVLDKLSQLVQIIVDSRFTADMFPGGLAGNHESCQL